MQRQARAHGMYARMDPPTHPPLTLTLTLEYSADRGGGTHSTVVALAPSGTRSAGARSSCMSLMLTLTLTLTLEYSADSGGGTHSAYHSGGTRTEWNSQCWRSQQLHVPDVNPSPGS